jgi:protein-S-isoprenylcysteine O-methyltransferase Ste14
MKGIVVFKLVQFAVLCVFVVFISDFRRKKDMVPLIGERWTYLLKASYLVPLAAYVFVLFTMSWISAFDVLALSLTLLGAGLVVKAKRDLSAHHTWAGYCLASTKFTTNGIYAYMRHPLYTGIYVLIIGSLFTVIPHLNLSVYITLPVAALISIAYVIGFLAFLANKETKALLERYGSPFQRYKETVHPFLPLKKYSVRNCE